MLPYSQEYLRFRSNPILLDQVAEKTDGEELDLTSEAPAIFDRARVTTTSDRPIADWFLIALACLVPLDVGIRRVQIDMELIRGWLGLTKTHTPSDETFTQLLRTKRTVEASLTERMGDRQRPQPAVQGELLTEEERAGVAAATPKRAAKPQAAAETEEAQSTTQRLLALKKQQQQEDES